MAKVEVKIFSGSTIMDYQTKEDVENIKDFMADLHAGMYGKRWFTVDGTNSSTTVLINNIDMIQCEYVESKKD